MCAGEGRIGEREGGIFLAALRGLGARLGDGDGGSYGGCERCVGVTVRV